MPKRKREGFDEQPASRNNTRTRASQRYSIDGQLSHGQKAIHRALKVAKGFERQKLSRRHKIAVDGSNEADAARIDSEIEALKSLDLASTAQTHLYKTLLKDKRIASSPSLPDAVRNFARAPQEPAVANVTARLYNSNPVKVAVTPVISAVRTTLDIPTDNVKPRKKDPNKSGKVDRDPPIDYEIPNDRPARSSPTYEPYDQSLGATAPPFSSLSSTNSAAAAAAASTAKDFPPATHDDDDDDVDADEDDGGSDLLGSDPEDDFQNPSEHNQRALDARIAGSTSTSPSASPPPTTTRTRTTFLPTLTTGYISASASASSRSPSPAAAPPQRKNRPGQRARQQRWEQKYGSDARHLQQDRGREGWDPRRGAVAPSTSASAFASTSMNADRRRNAERDERLRAREEKQQERQRAAAEKKAREAKPLHPSWEAARRRKEMAKVKEGDATARGKKVVFD